VIDIVVDQKLCIACGACIDLCTARVFQMVAGNTEAMAPEECWLCGHCVAACPSDAITHREYPIEACPSLDADALPALDQLVAAFRERRSARVFHEKPVPRQIVRQLVDISRWAPSASNEQPVDWLAFDDRAQIAALSAQAVAVLAGTDPALKVDTAGGEEDLQYLAERLASGRDPIFLGAPAVLVGHVPAVDDFGRDDAVYAVYNLMLAAQRLGLGTCQIGYFQMALERSQDLRLALGLTDDRRAEVTVILGYPVYDFQRVLPRRRPELAWSSGVGGE
jgi:nitroreductase/NAD-dependent dihydropyrimidine dehydrogenase PreA subunit